MAEEGASCGSFFLFKWEAGMPGAGMTLADVIGKPDTWPDYSHRNEGKRVNMRGARIADFAAFNDEILIATQGSAGGPTFGVFLVEDPQLRKRAMKVLKVGLNVNVAVRLAI